MGTTLGRYAIQSRLGEGGMGFVYRAEQWPLGRAVALKVIHRALLQDAKTSDRFLREAKIACSLTNPHTVTIYDFGRADDGTLYLAMELLVGESLQQVLAREKRVQSERAAEIAAQVCRSLMEAHRKGIIHRDLKPDNIFLTTADDGSMLVKVLDYGLARVVSGDDTAPSTLLTQIGTIVGTPIYMSPEQARGKKLDRRSDLYSMGVVLFEMLTGEPPFDDEDAIVVLSKHIKNPVPAMSAIGARVQPPPELEALIRTLLEKLPEHRPPDAMTVYHALREYLVMHSSHGSRLPAMPAEEGSQPKQLARLMNPHAESGILPRVGPALSDATVQEALPDGEWESTAVGGMKLGLEAPHDTVAADIDASPTSPGSTDSLKAFMEAATAGVLPASDPAIDVREEVTTAMAPDSGALASLESHPPLTGLSMDEPTRNLWLNRIGGRKVAVAGLAAVLLLVVVLVLTLVPADEPPPATTLGGDRTPVVLPEASPDVTRPASALAPLPRALPPAEVLPPPPAQPEAEPVPGGTVRTEAEPVPGGAFRTEAVPVRDRVPRVVRPRLKRPPRTGPNGLVVGSDDIFGPR